MQLPYTVLAFCHLGVRLDEKLTPAPVVDAAMKGNAIFDIPIVVIPGKLTLAVLYIVI